MLIRMLCVTSAIALGPAMPSSWQDRDLAGLFRREKVVSGAPSAVPPIHDLKRAFEAVREKQSRPVTSRNRNLLSSMPSGYDKFPKFHQQGIQKLSSGGFVVSGSTPTGSASYFYVTDPAGNVINVTVIESGAFSHAGGIQVSGNILGVGTENPSDHGAGSRIHFYDLVNPAQPRKLALVIN